MSSILPLGKTTFEDANGVPLALGTVDFYIPNTHVRKDTYQDAAASILNTNPVVLDAAGRALIWGTGQYRQLVKDVLGNTIWDQVTGEGIAGANSVSTTATIATLRALTAPSASPITMAVQGYYAAGDGGGGEFYWDASSALTDDTGRIINPTGNVGNGRWIRLLPENEVLDARYYGCIEGQTTAVNSDALMATITACQKCRALTGTRAVTTVRLVGTYTIDASRFPYTAGQSRLNNVIFMGINLSLEFLILELGGIITFSNSATTVNGEAFAANTFYLPQGWEAIGVSATDDDQFASGQRTKIIGDFWVSSTNNLARNIHVTGQARFAKVGTPGQVAYIKLENFGATVPNNSRPAIYIGDALEIFFQNWTASMLSGAGNAVYITNTSIGTGLIDFQQGLISGGNVKIDSVGVGGNGIGSIKFSRMTSENLAQSFLVDINANSPGNGDGNYTFEDVQIADQAVPAQLLTISGTSCGQVTCIRTNPGLDSSLSKITKLVVESGQAFLTTTIDCDMSVWRPSQRIQVGDFTSAINSSVGHDCSPGYVKPTYKSLAAPIAAGFATVTAGGFDGVSDSYTIAATTGTQPFIIQQDLVLPALVAGDVIIAGWWSKRQNQGNILPNPIIQLLTGGGAQTDAFSATTNAIGNPITKYVGGFTWYYAYSAFKVSSGITPALRASLGPIPTTATLEVSALQLIVATGNLTRWECHELAMANSRYPRISGKAAYYSWPNACHLLQMMNLVDLGGDPSVLEDGDVWRNGSNLKCRLGGATKTFTVV